MIYNIFIFITYPLLFNLIYLFIYHLGKNTNPDTEANTEKVKRAYTATKVILRNTGHRLNM